MIGEIKKTVSRNWRSRRVQRLQSMAQTDQRLEGNARAGLSH
jgi:hypothetical protein